MYQTHKVSIYLIVKKLVNDVQSYYYQHAPEEVDLEFAYKVVGTNMRDVLKCVMRESGRQFVIKDGGERRQK